MDEPHSHYENLKTVGGVLCLDFANTASARDTATPTERLHSYDDLTAWAEHVEIIPAEMGELLRAEAACRPAEADDLFRRALELREAIFHIFACVVEGAALADGDVALLNANIAASYPHLRLVTVDNTRFEWGWEKDIRHLDRVLWPVARSAAEELTSGELARVRMCQGEHCGWLFIDRSKNRSRRWCDMQDCGNVEKVRRYRRRQKE
jgi:predicted RNA-binding Zn ribbon-like protein